MVDKHEPEGTGTQGAQGERLDEVSERGPRLPELLDDLLDLGPRHVFLDELLPLRSLLGLLSEPFDLGDRDDRVTPLRVPEDGEQEGDFALDRLRDDAVRDPGVPVRLDGVLGHERSEPADSGAFTDAVELVPGPESPRCTRVGLDLRDVPCTRMLGGRTRMPSRLQPRLR